MKFIINQGGGGGGSRYYLKIKYGIFQVEEIHSAKCLLQIENGIILNK